MENPSCYSIFGITGFWNKACQIGTSLRYNFQYRERFLVCKGDELIVLYVDDINYFYVEDNHVFAFTNTDTSYQLPTTMNALEQELDPNKFFRINRQYIANIKGIKKISMFFSSKLIVRI